jgi:hypothetical protein
MTDYYQNEYNSNINNIKRSKKPKPLFGIFKSNKQQQILVNTTPLGSGTAVVPIQSSIISPIQQQQQKNVLLSPQFNKTSSSSSSFQQIRRPRSKSVGRDPSSFSHSQNSRLIEERESALNKLCQKEIIYSPTSPASSAHSLSLVDNSLILATIAPPPVPPIPIQHQPPQKQMRKFSSAHDLRKAAKLQQDQLAQLPQLPTPKQQQQQMSRSKSLKLNHSKSHQQIPKLPTTPNVMLMSKPRYPPLFNSSKNDSDDDDIPLGYLAAKQQNNKPSSLLSDKEEDDDKDLIPIATTTTVKNTNHFKTAADKYKLKVKERLFNDSSNNSDEDDDDDDLPISNLLLKK